MYTLSTFFALALSATSARAAPQLIPNGKLTCDYEIKPTEVHTKVYEAAPEYHAWTCTSSPLGPCTLSEGASVSKSTALSIGVGLDVKFKTASLGEWAPKFQMGYTWTNTKGETRSATVYCPSGGMQCGIMSTALMCELSGPAKMVYKQSGQQKNCPKNPPFNRVYDWKVTSVCVKGDSKNEKMNAVIDFEPCVLHCRKEDNCDKGRANQMKPCPGVQGFPFK